MSTAVSIRCPHCQRKLKIEDRKVLGKKVKCPGCSRPFVVRDPAEDEEVTLRLADEEDGPPVGTSARWVPDDPPLDPNPLVFSSGPKEPSKGKSEAPEPGLEFPAFAPPADLGDLNIKPAAGGEAPPSTSGELERLRKRRRRATMTTYAAVGAVMLIGILVTAFVVMNYESAPPGDPVAGTQSEPPGRGGGAGENRDENQPYSKPRLEGNPGLVTEFAPTDGDPIELYMMPSGINLLFHLRPADLWSNKIEYQRLRASLTDDVTDWIAGTLQEICRREPAEIEEALVGIIFAARGIDPHICAVVRLKEPAKMSELLEEFKGTYLYDITEKPDLRLRVDGEYGYLIHDERTIAICPELMAGELEHWVKRPNHEISEAMAQLLERTDRQRLFTVVGEMNDLRIQLPYQFPEPARMPFEHVFEWLGEDVEAVSWSIHVEPYLHSEVRLKPVNTSSATRLRDRLGGQMEELPKMMWQQVAVKMQPREMRFRQFIGRFPAMLEAFQRSTVMGTDSRHLQLTTVLPAKAAPNLALATLFTVNEAARTDFGTDSAVAAAEPEKTKLPESAAERLKLTVDAEFNRTPLQPALEYLCAEVEVNLFLDGDALEDAGYTRNMPQTYDLGKVPMEQALAAIINGYQEQGREMVVSVNEETKTVTVTTRKFAEQRELPIYPLPE